MSLLKISRMREKIINGPLGTKVLVYCLLLVFGFLAMIVIPRYVLDPPDWLKDFLFIFFLVTFLYMTRSGDWTIGSLLRQRCIRKGGAGGIGGGRAQKDKDS